MVERLKQAIEKARLARENQSEQGVRTPIVARAASDLDRRWATIAAIDTTALKQERNRVVSLDRAHPAHVSFDRLRTRVFKICSDNGWSQIAVTSPTRACGKTMTSLNLALSMARNPAKRILALELDMRAPSLKRMLGDAPPAGVDALLSGAAEPEAVVRGLQSNLALGMPAGRVDNSSELLLAPSSIERLAALRRWLAPDITIYDLPPMFGCDDALAFLPNVDAVLLVAGAGATSADDIAECERLIGDSTAIMGVVLNKVAERDLDTYGVEYNHEDVSA